MIHRRKNKEQRPGVLTSTEINERLSKPISDVHSLVVTPYPDPIEGDSIDLGLGCHFFIPKSHRTSCFVPGLTNPLYLYDEQHIPIGYYLVLPAHHTVLGATLEYIKLPSDVSGQILTKSSWARTFITIETAPWIHPLYRGCLTLEIANVSNAPVVLYPGVKIAQLVLLKTSSDTVRRNRDEISGTYIGPVRPEPAQLKDPEWALAYPTDEYLVNIAFRKHICRQLQKNMSLEEFEDYMKVCLADDRFRHVIDRLTGQ
jgi:dCTP deaminase